MPGSGAWSDDPELWSLMDHWMFTPAIMAAGERDAADALRLLDLAPGSAVLDMPCGAGRHCVEFAKAGHRVTGADLTERFLERARERATRQGVGVEFIRADMREFRRREAFDAVTNLWTSFGYFDDPADDARVLENFFESLRPGGRLLMDMMGREPLVRLFRPREWRYDNEDRICIEERKVNDDWTRIENRWIMLDGEVRREATFRLRVFGAAELRSMVTGAGFVDVRILGSLAGGPYDHKAERLVLVARKP